MRVMKQHTEYCTQFACPPLCPKRQSDSKKTRELVEKFLNGEISFEESLGYKKGTRIEVK